MSESESSADANAKPTLLEQIKPARYQVHPFQEAVAVALVIIFATFSTTYFIYERALHAQEAEIRQGLLRTAHVAASIIDADTHQSFTSPEDEQTERYQAALAPLIRMQQSDPQIAYLYTAIQKGDKYHFIFDVTPSPTNPDEEDTSVGVMEVYDDALENKAFIRAFETKKPSTSDQPYTDEYGRFISGFVPLKDKAGNFYGVLGMDIDIKVYEARLAPIRRATTRAFVAAFFVAFLMASAVWFLRNFIFVVNDKRVALYEMLKMELQRRKTERSSESTHE